MRKSLVRIALLVCAPPLCAGAKPSQPGKDAADRLVEAVQAADAGDCAKALKLARPIADKPEALGLSEMGVAIAYDTVARCDFQAGDHERAFAEIRKASAIPESPDRIWYHRLDLDVMAKQWESAVGTLEAMADGRGGALNGITQRAMSYIENELRRAERKDLQVRFWRLLSNNAYSPTELMVSTDSYRRQYAVYMASSGDRQAARALVADLVDPWSVARASLDPRLRAFFPADPDVRALVERRLQDRQRLMRTYPDLLEPVIEVASNLQSLGRSAEALAVLQSVSKRVAEPESFTDLQEQLSWYWDELSHVYVTLGRYDEAVDALKKGGALAENGGANVSQTINLAHLQTRIGRYDDALATLATFDRGNHEVSPYGQIALRSARACARELSGRHEAALEDAAYIRAHQLDAPGSLDPILICLGDFDGAAASLIKRLENPDEQAQVLLDLSDYDPAPVKLPDNLFNKGQKVLADRPDVKAAIAKAGGTRRFHIQG